MPVGEPVEHHPADVVAGLRVLAARVPQADDELHDPVPAASGPRQDTANGPGTRSGGARRAMVSRTPRDGPVRMRAPTRPGCHEWPRLRVTGAGRGLGDPAPGAAPAKRVGGSCPMADERRPRRAPSARVTGSRGTRRARLDRRPGRRLRHPDPTAVRDARRPPGRPRRSRRRPPCRPAPSTDPAPAGDLGEGGRRGRARRRHARGHAGGAGRRRHHDRLPAHLARRNGARGPGRPPPRRAARHAGRRVGRRRVASRAAGRAAPAPDRCTGSPWCARTAAPRRAGPPRRRARSTSSSPSPATQATAVPVDTGIELRFDQAGVATADLERHLVIEPATDGPPRDRRPRHRLRPVAAAPGGHAVHGHRHPRPAARRHGPAPRAATRWSGSRRRRAPRRAVHVGFRRSFVESGTGERRASGSGWTSPASTATPTTSRTSPRPSR